MDKSKIKGEPPEVIEPKFEIRSGRFSFKEPQRQSIPKEEFDHWSSENGCHEDCPACRAEPNLIVGEYPPLSAEDLLPRGLGGKDEPK